MSLKAYQAVWEHSTARGTDLLVLLALADFADEKGCSWPSIDAIAKKARISQRAVQRHIKSLEESGEIEVQVQAGAYGTNRYLLKHTQAPPEALGGVSSVQGDNLSGGVTSAVRKSDHEWHPNRKESSGTVKQVAFKRARAVRLPDDFTPNSTAETLSAQLGVDLHEELERFRDHHGARATLMVDWQLAFKSWLRKAPDFKARGSPANGQGPPKGRNERNFDEALRRMGVRDESTGSGAGREVPLRGLPSGRVEP